MNKSTSYIKVPRKLRYDLSSFQEGLIIELLDIIDGLEPKIKELFKDPIIKDIIEHKNKIVKLNEKISKKTRAVFDDDIKAPIYLCFEDGNVREISPVFLDILKNLKEDTEGE